MKIVATLIILFGQILFTACNKQVASSTPVSPTPFDATAGVIVGSSANIFVSKGINNPWNSVTSPITNLLGVAFSSPLNGIAVTNNNIIRTQDGGSSWKIAYTNSAIGYLQSIAFSSATNGVAVGLEGTIVRTTDGGGTWNVISNTGIDSDLNGVSFSTANNGMAVGFNGTILRTSDGGASWTIVRQTVDAQEVLSSIAFANTDTAVAVGTNLQNDYGIILLTKNGGTTWNELPNSSGKDLVGVTFSSTTNGVAVGWDGTIMRTINGGASWQQISSPSKTLLNAVAFGNKDYGIAVGNDIFQTIDGGASWTPVNIQTNQVSYGIAFANKM